MSKPAYEKLTKLTNTLRTLSEIKLGISEAMALDEVTEVGLGLAAGLAQSALTKIGVVPRFDEPGLDDIGIKTNHLNSGIDSIFNQLLPIRTKAQIAHMSRAQATIKAHVEWLKKYQTIFPNVITVATYGLADAPVLNGTRKVSDEEATILVANGLDQATATFANATISLLNEATSKLQLLDAPAISEWRQTNTNRFTQGDGFSPVAFPDCKTDIIIRSFKDKCIQTHGESGGLALRTNLFEKDVEKTSMPTIQDTNLIIAAYASFIDHLNTAIKSSELINDDLNPLFMAMQNNPMDIADYDAYWSISDCDVLSVNIARVADMTYLQLMTIEAMLGNLVEATPTVMNYCISDKI